MYIQYIQYIRGNAKTRKFFTLRGFVFPHEYQSPFCGPTSSFGPTPCFVPIYMQYRRVSRSPHQCAHTHTHTHTFLFIYHRTSQSRIVFPHLKSVFIHAPYRCSLTYSISSTHRHTCTVHMVNLLMSMLRSEDYDTIVDVTNVFSFHTVNLPSSHANAEV